jgi:ribosomal-protein-alanine N-acetyltransferase
VIADGTPADTAEMVALDERNFASEDRFDRRLWRTILGGRLRGSEMLTLVAREEGAVVGAIVGEFRRSVSRLIVWSIAVDEPQRGAGLAQRLVAELVSRTPHTVTQVTLDARRDNLRARRFYERLGFQATHEVRAMYADGTDGIAYATTLASLRQALAQT